MISKKYTYDKKFTRVLVISDSHRHISNAIHMIDVGRFDQVIHLGDLTADAEDLKSIYDSLIIHAVKGNCDFYDSETPELLMIEINGAKLLACHGHQYGVKGSTERLERVARGCNAHVAMFGHSHRRFLDQSGEVILLNPGSISEPRDGKGPSCSIIEIEQNGIIHVTLHEIKKT